MKKAALAAAAFAAFLLGACGKQPDEVPARPSPTATIAAQATRASDRTVTDMAGRSVTIPDSVRTVVALSPSAADFANALGMEVIGRTTDTPEASAPAAKPVGSALSPDFNTIAVLAPDLVIADAAYQSGRTRDFDRFSHPVFVLKAGTYPEVLSALTALGKATNRETEADSARSALEARAASALEAAKSRGGSPRVLILTGGGRDVFGGSSATYLGSLLQFLGATNVLGSVADGGPIPGFGVIDVSQSASLNPDIVLILNSGQGGLGAQIQADKAWAGTAALRDRRVIELDTTLFLRSPGPRAGEALETLVALLWP